MAVTGIGGIFFKAQNPAALAAWYEEHLGVARDDDGYTVFGWRLLDAPDTIGESVWSAFPADTDYFAPSDSSWMVNFRVDDLDATLQRLRDAGCEIVGEKHKFDYGEFGWVLDPEGNKIELWEPTTPQFPITVPATRVSLATRAPSERAIVKEVDVDISPESLWPLWTSSEGLAEWLVPSSRIEPWVGGAYEFYFLPDNPTGSRGGEGCKVLSLLPHRMLSFTWNAPPHLDYTRSRHTYVVVEFDAVEAGTHVRLTHLGWPSDDDHPQWDETYAYFDAAWQRVLDALAAHAADSYKG